MYTVLGSWSRDAACLGSPMAQVLRMKEGQEWLLEEPAVELTRLSMHVSMCTHTHALACAHTYNTLFKKLFIKLKIHTEKYASPKCIA